MKYYRDIIVTEDEDIFITVPERVNCSCLGCAFSEFSDNNTLECTRRGRLLIQAVCSRHNIIYIKASKINNKD